MAQVMDDLTPAQRAAALLRVMDATDAAAPRRDPTPSPPMLDPLPAGASLSDRLAAAAAGGVGGAAAAAAAAGDPYGDMAFGGLDDGGDARMGLGGDFGGYGDDVEESEWQKKVSAFLDKKDRDFADDLPPSSPVHLRPLQDRLAAAARSPPGTPPRGARYAGRARGGSWLEPAAPAADSSGSGASGQFAGDPEIEWAMRSLSDLEKMVSRPAAASLRDPLRDPIGDHLVGSAAGSPVYGGGAASPTPPPSPGADMGEFVEWATGMRRSKAAPAPRQPYAERGAAKGSWKERWEKQVGLPWGDEDDEEESSVSQSSGPPSDSDSGKAGAAAGGEGVEGTRKRKKKDRSGADASPREKRKRVKERRDRRDRRHGAAAAAPPPRADERRALERLRRWERERERDRRERDRDRRRRDR